MNSQTITVGDVVQATGAPFVLDTTGGGCTAWMWEVGDRSILLTVVGDAMAPDSFPMQAGFYEVWDDAEPLMTVVHDMTELVAFVDGCRSGMVK